MLSVSSTGPSALSRSQASRHDVFGSRRAQCRSAWLRPRSTPPAPSMQPARSLAAHVGMPSARVRSHRREKLVPLSRPYPQSLASPGPGALWRRRLEARVHADILQPGRRGARHPAAGRSSSLRCRAGAGLDRRAHAGLPASAASASGSGTEVRVRLPQAVHLAGQPGATLTNAALADPGRIDDAVRLQQLLAQLGYLPLEWLPSADAVSARWGPARRRAIPPAGHFSWRFHDTPRELQRTVAPGSGERDHARRGDQMSSTARPRGRRAARPAVLGGAHARRHRRQAPHDGLQLERLRCTPQTPAIAQPLA